MEEVKGCTCWFCLTGGLHPSKHKEFVEVSLSPTSKTFCCTSCGHLSQLPMPRSSKPDTPSDKLPTSGMPLLVGLISL